MHLNYAAQLLGAEGGYFEEAELFMPAEWFGIIMFGLLMLMLLTTVAFTSRGKQLPAQEHEDH